DDAHKKRSAGEDDGETLPLDDIIVDDAPVSAKPEAPVKDVFEEDEELSHGRNRGGSPAPPPAAPPAPKPANGSDFGTTTPSQAMPSPSVILGGREPSAAARREEFLNPAFTAYHPYRVQPGQAYALMVFAHIASAADAVHQIAAGF